MVPARPTSGDAEAEGSDAEDKAVVFDGRATKTTKGVFLHMPRSHQHAHNTEAPGEPLAPRPQEEGSRQGTGACRQARSEAQRCCARQKAAQEALSPCCHSPCCHSPCCAFPCRSCSHAVRFEGAQSRPRKATHFTIYSTHEVTLRSRARSTSRDGA